MPYKPLSAKTVEDCRVDTDWGCMRWLASRDIGNVDGLTLGRVTIKPGEANPRHVHANCEEVLYLLAGSLEHTAGDETVVLHGGDTFVVPAGVAHNARNVGERDADMIVCYSSGERTYERE